MDEPQAKLLEITRKDPRYGIEAYYFVFRALSFTVQNLKKEEGGSHVTGQELLDGIRDLGRRDFGFLAKLVFNMWGVGCTRDFGNIVFNLVNEGLMGSTREDSIEDFEDGFDFEEAFEKDLGLEFEGR